MRWLVRKHKVIPCLNSANNRRGWKIVEDNKYEWEYSPDGKSFTIYYNYQDALDDCRHLNGGSEVFGSITQGNWDILRNLVKGYGRKL